MNNESYAGELIKMRAFDLETRERLAATGELFKGYNPVMEQMHLQNAKRLEEMMHEIGWPDKEKVGEQARDAAMLIVQHAISLPAFQRTCLHNIKAAIDAGKEDKRNYAFLHDRIRFNERRPQRFGTQYDWDRNGQMSPWRLENPENINELRKEYGLNPIEEETAAVRKGILQSNDIPPESYEKRQQEILNWSRKTGWLE
jgi:hypothetical protein